MYLKPRSSYVFDINNNIAKFPLNIENVLLPIMNEYNCSVDFTINSELNNNHVWLELDNKSEEIWYDFIKRNFVLELQLELQIKISLKCFGSNFESCPYCYQLNSKFLTFDLYTGIINEISIESEKFKIRDNNHLYNFDIDYQSNSAVISYNTFSQTSILPVQNTINIPVSKIAKYDFNKEYIMEKTKTLLLFS